ncbi:28S ribosomal protein S16-like protein [Leptotrombidium deliense]|uniref:Small ribosomal subunit protein bS16m n=1 Tax=Leptotrombidium deliense TaxID=299467 RepID=A0A443SVE6_9ACAR|nr:28S ribosomal protein S16-like protein [Leptotrombidium deliense]
MVRIAKFYKHNLAIRLHRIGCANRPFYQIGVIPNMKRVGRIPDEVFGSYDPMPNENNEKLVAIDLDRLAYWLGQGAVPSISMKRILGLIGFFPMYPPLYKEAWEKRLKASVLSENNADENSNEFATQST